MGTPIKSVTLTSMYFAYQSFKLQNYIVGGVDLLRKGQDAQKREGEKRERERESCVCNCQHAQLM